MYFFNLWHDIISINYIRIMIECDPWMALIGVADKMVMADLGLAVHFTDGFPLQFKIWWTVHFDLSSRC